MSSIVFKAPVEEVVLISEELDQLFNFLVSVAPFTPTGSYTDDIYAGKHRKE